MKKAIVVLVATLVLLAAPAWSRPDVTLIAGFGDIDILGASSADGGNGGIDSQA